MKDLYYSLILNEHTSIDWLSYDRAKDLYYELVKDSIYRNLEQELKKDRLYPALIKKEGYEEEVYFKNSQTLKDALIAGYRENEEEFHLLVKQLDEQEQIFVYLYLEGLEEC